MILSHFSFIDNQLINEAQFMGVLVHISVWVSLVIDLLLKDTPHHLQVLFPKSIVRIRKEFLLDQVVQDLIILISDFRLLLVILIYRFIPSSLLTLGSIISTRLTTVIPIL